MQPSYRTSRRQIWLSFWFGWIVILGIVGAGLSGSNNAIELASIVVPSMILLIAALLGIHRFSGSLDFAATASSPFPPAASYNPRDEPPNSEDAR